ncbi:hypothetical protein QYF36_019890 [Acer negundo]|nr:hypothetical protein QYF36_019890 [Acer negundo]
MVDLDFHDLAAQKGYQVEHLVLLARSGVMDLTSPLPFLNVERRHPYVCKELESPVLVLCLDFLMVELVMTTTLEFLDFGERIQHSPVLTWIL